MTDRLMNQYLTRALKENPRLDVAAWKKGWYLVGRKLKENRNALPNAR